MLADCHLHTEFSPDGRIEPRDMIEAAISKGLKHIAITDHTDLFHPEGYIGVDREILPKYISRLAKLKNEYKNKIYVAVGLEVGYMEIAETDSALLLKDTYPEYVINSIHCVNGTDCYSRGHFLGQDKKTSYGHYLKAVKRSLDAPYRYDAIGHLGYIERVAPFDDVRMAFAEFSTELTDIFETIIARGAILELNTSVSGAPSVCLPSPELIQVYYDMGGRRVTTSSDAHTCARIGENFDEVELILKKIGFTYLTVKQDGELRELKL